MMNRRPRLSSQVLAEPVLLAGPGDRHDRLRLRQHPGQRDLRRGDLVALRDLGDEVDDGLVPLR